MQIFIKTLTGKVIPLEVIETDTIEMVKRQIQDIKGISYEKQRFIFAGMMLNNTKTILDYNIQKDSIIYLALKLKDYKIE
jgi:hypothetical protein